ncbi:peptidase M23-like protein [Mucilaginibacter gracilis]|uniref:Peptidase M23-like protein n=1 Tax=Mucilaginibacter gracilis TaxID=423350 RepID=A0A495J918_9SPHI|nr:M23 family metallopeptidase [Mucilaginibacter gracilis]RKR85397.1 peptidase M23-like protein [Mucilaginibacter gracilis]
MNIKRTDNTSTVVILNKSEQHIKSFQIKTKHLGRLKHYSAGIFVLVALLIGCICYLQNQNSIQAQEKQQLLAQLKAKGTLPVNHAKTGTGISAQSYIQSIQLKLRQINDYLRKRGLKEFSTTGEGGSGKAEGAKLSEKDAYMYYDEYLKHLVAAVGFTPMGYPRSSSFTSSFGFRGDPFNANSAEFHPGIDFAGKKGDAVKCTANGKVIFAGWNGGYGNCVQIAHGNNLVTLFGHLSRIVVKVGQAISVGDKVGEVGSTGHSTGPHLHYEIRKDGKAVNPVNFLTLNK